MTKEALNFVKIPLSQEGREKVKSRGKEKGKEKSKEKSKEKEA